MEGTRDALIGGAGWDAALQDLIVLVPLSAAGLYAGVMALRVALSREHRRGTLGLY
jgi:hypothetical protein